LLNKPQITFGLMD